VFILAPSGWSVRGRRRLERYSAWALAEVNRWPTTGPDAAPRGPQILDEQLKLFG
jgi:hypothetical protein